MPPITATSARWYVLASVAIVGVVAALYWSTLEHEFLGFDDRKYIYDNELVVGEGGLSRIWLDLFNTQPKLHYNPVTYSSFWLEHQLVGPLPTVEQVPGAMGQPAHPLFHATQIALHALNACLVLLVLRALGVSFVVSVFVAVFFAVHPVNVASVAWTSERKNLLSAAFMWWALLLYIGHRRAVAETALGARGTSLRYLLSLLAFVLALGSKASALVLAPILVITDRLLDGHWSWASLRRALPYFALAALSSALVMHREAFIGNWFEPVALWARPFNALAAIVHYVGTVIAPVEQAIIYPRWEVALGNPRYWISLLAVTCASWLVWRQRRRLGDHFLWGLGVFLLSVAPILGFKAFVWMDFAFVSDHYMYHGSVGVLLTLGIAAERWYRPAGRASKQVPGPAVWKAPLLCGLAFVALAGCIWRVTQLTPTWRDNQTLWSHTIEVSPRAVVARINLGNHYLRHGQPEKALEQYRTWSRLRPDHALAWIGCARAAQALGRTGEARHYYRLGVRAARNRRAAPADAG